MHDAITIDSDDDEEKLQHHSTLKHEASKPVSTSNTSSHLPQPSSSSRRANSRYTNDDDDDFNAAVAASSASFAASSAPAAKPATPFASSSSSLLPSSDSTTLTRQELLASCAHVLLPFHRDIICQFNHEDGLVILGRGLGIQHIWTGFIAQYMQYLPMPSDNNRLASSSSSSASSVPSSSPSDISPHLVFLLNFDETLVNWMNQVYQTRFDMESSSMPGEHHNDRKQKRARGIKILNAEYQAHER